MENKNERKRINISRKYKLYLFGLAGFLVLSFICLSICLISYKIEEEEKILKDKIYAEKQQHVENQVSSAISTINTLRDGHESKMKNDLKDRVDEAYDIAMNIYKVYKDNHSKEEVQYMITEALRTPRFFNGRGYYFINKENGLSVLYPINTHESKIHAINYSIKDLSKLFMKNLTSKDTAYVSYKWNTPSDTLNYTHEKTSYVRRFKPYKWIIGTGDYIEDINEELKIKALKKLSEIKYDKHGYIFVFDINGDVVYTKDASIHKQGHIRNFKGIDGKNLFPVIKQKALNEGGCFFSFRCNSPSDNKSFDYEAYIKYLADWEWMVGGFTRVDIVDDIIKSNEASLSKELYNVSLIIIAFIIFVILLVIGFGRYIQRRIDAYFKRFYTEFKESTNKQILMPTKDTVFEEEYQLIININGLLKQTYEDSNELINREKELTVLNNTKDRFFSIIAHDLKNPFNSLMGILEVLLSDYDELDDIEKKEYLLVVNDSSNKLYRLLDDLLQWSRLQTSGLKCDIKSHLISYIINTQIKILDEQASAKDIRITTNMSEDDLVNVDINMISTVVRNLLSNAIKFSNNGGSIIITTKKKENRLVVSVQDNGLGIARENLDKLFYLEEKISTIGTANEVGTGLGLILCKEFVEKNGGRIMVTSTQGEGSCFSFTVPLAIVH